MNKRDVVDRMLVIHEHIAGLRADVAAIEQKIAGFQAEHDVLAGVLEKWPDGEAALGALDDDLPDTLPGTPKTKSSTKMRAVRPEEKYMDVDRFALTNLIDAARAADSPHVDLGPLLGLEKPFTVGVDDLHDAILHRELPDSVSLHFDGDKTVVIKKTDGGVMATFTMEW